MLEARIYVGTYHKYNSGSIAGKWLNLEDYADAEAFYKACAELHSDEADPEYMFQDFEGFPKDLYSESGNIDAVYEYINLVRNSDLDQDVIDAGLKLGIPFESIEEAYQGQYDSDGEFAQQTAEGCGMIPDNLGWPLCYIDWERAARELMMDYQESNHHYFSCNW